jgi:hypothetical protein
MTFTLVKGSYLWGQKSNYVLKALVRSAPRSSYNYATVKINTTYNQTPTPSNTQPYAVICGDFQTRPSGTLYTRLADHVWNLSYPISTPFPTTSPTSAPIPTPTQTACQKADINQDNFVDLTDYSVIAVNFFSSSPSNPRADINADGFVDLSDYSLLAVQFLKACN